MYDKKTFLLAVFEQAEDQGVAMGFYTALSMWAVYKRERSLTDNPDLQRYLDKWSKQ